MSCQFFREIFDFLQFEDFVLINKVPFFQCIFESNVAVTQNVDSYEYKKQRNTAEKCLVPLRFEPGAPDPKSAMLTPRPKFHENC